MKKLLTILFILICFQSYATHYFVSSSTGNDANNGTSTTTPWKTLTKVNSFAFAAGDICSFLGGDTFIGSLIITRSGTSGNPITFNSYGTGRAIITALSTVPSFVNMGNNIWESTTSVSGLNDCNLLLINGVNTQMGRFPNSGYLTYQSHSTNVSITSSSLNSSVTNWTGADAVVKCNNFQTLRNLVSAQSGTLLTMIPTSETSTAINFTDGFGFFIENDLRTLDQQNEWYFNPTTKKLDIYSTSQPTNVQLPTIDSLVFAQGRSNITFDNLTFIGSNRRTFYLCSCQNFTIQNCFCDDAGLYTVWGGNNCGGSSTGFIFQNNVVNHNNSKTIFMQNEFTGSYIGHNRFLNGGVLPGMFKIPATNPLTTNGQWGGAFNVVSVIGNNGFVCEYNYIDSSGRFGINFTGNGACRVNNNETIHCGINSQDGGDIYTIGVRTGISQIYSNICHDGIGDSTGTANTDKARVWHGIYCDDATSNTQVFGNTIFSEPDAGIFIHSGHEDKVRDNTIYDIGKYGVLFQYGAAIPIRNDTLKNNILVARTGTQKAASFQSAANDISSFFTSIDSNVYARPIDDNLTIEGVINNFATFTQRSLPQWQAYQPTYDIHSTRSPRPATLAQLSLIYNPNNYDSTVSLNGNFVGMTNIAYNTSTVLHAYTSLILINTGTLITPTITWNNPANITYGTTLSATQLNASTGIAGTFTYTPIAGTLLDAGTYTLSVLFTPTDGNTYTSASKTVTLIVDPAPASISYANLTQMFTGSPLQPTITTTPAGLKTSTTYNGVGTIPVNSGSYTTITGITNTNYVATPATATFTISKANAVISVSNLSQVYDATSKSINTSTTPAGLDGITVTYNGSATLPVNAGTYNVLVTLNNSNFTASPISTTLIISKATPTVSWSNPSAITYGTALSGTQLNATSSVAGTFTYTPAAGTVLNAGTQSLSVDFVPTDGANYNSVIGTTVTIVVNKAVATLTLFNLNQTFDGNPKSVTVVTTPVGLGVVTVTYNGSTTQPTAVGTYPVVATLINSNYTASPATGNLVISSSVANIFITNLLQAYNGSPRPVTVTTNPTGLTYTVTYNGSATVPTNAGTYVVIATLVTPFTGADTQTLVITKSIPVINWSNPASIPFGTALSGIQLNASSTVSGSFTYTPPSGTVLNVGTQTLSVSFAPSDASNYNSASATVQITVNNSSATLTLSNLLQTYDGTPKAVIVTSNPAGLSIISVTYNGSATIPTNAGSYAVVATLTNANFTATPVNGTLIINKVNANLSWNIPAPIAQGTALSSQQLNATSNIAGTFTYNYTLGSILNPGTVTLQATFHPTDNVNYTSGQTISVPLSVYGSPFLNFTVTPNNYQNLPNQ